MVPKEWEVKSFSELLKSNDVEKIQDGNHGNSHPKSSDFVDSGIPFVMARDLKNGTVDLENCAYITKEQADSLRIGFAKTGDILLSHKGTVGLVAIVPLCDEYMMLTPQVTYYRIPQDSSLMNSYLYQFLLSHEYQSRFKNLAFQSTRSYLGITAQKNLSINLPPLPEQQKIAKILSTWDKAISTTERLIDNSSQQKKALMQQLLTGKKRLLDESGQRFEGEWQNIRLGDLTSKITKGTTPSSNGYQFQEKGINFVKIESITRDGKFIPSKFAHISDECHESFKRSQLKKNDILFSIAGALGRVAMVTEEILPSNTNQALAVIRLKPNIIDLSFLFFFLNSPQIAKKIMIMSVQAAQANLSLKDIGNLPISKPSLEEQQKIAAILTNADKEIELLEQQLAGLQQEKKALMQVLLTGKKRVVVDRGAA